MTNVPTILSGALNSGSVTSLNQRLVQGALTSSNISTLNTAKNLATCAALASAADPSGNVMSGIGGAINGALTNPYNGTVSNPYNAANSMPYNGSNGMPMNNPSNMQMNSVPANNTMNTQFNNAANNNYNNVASSYNTTTNVAYSSQNINPMNGMNNNMQMNSAPNNMNGMNNNMQMNAAPNNMNGMQSNMQMNTAPNNMNGMNNNMQMNTAPNNMNGMNSNTQMNAAPGNMNGMNSNTQMNAAPNNMNGMQSNMQMNAAPNNMNGMQSNAQSNMAPTPAPAPSPAPTSAPVAKPIPTLTKCIQKGQKASIEQNGKLTKAFARLGWNSTNSECDVDVSAFLLNNTGKVIGDSWFVFYGQETSPDQSTVFSVDNGEDREVISIDFSKLDQNVSKIVFVLTINEAFEKNLNFSMLKDAYVRIMDDQNNELVSFQMTDYYSNVTSMMIGELYQHNGLWKFNAIGNGVAKDLSGLCELYGVQVE